MRIFYLYRKGVRKEWENWILPAVLTGFLMDLCIGDPRWMYHPVCMIGNAITACEKWLRAWFPKTKRGEQMAGGVLVLCIVSGCVLIPGGLLFLAYRLHPAAGFILESCMCWQMLATKSLKTESMKVYERLQAEDVDGGEEGCFDDCGTRYCRAYRRGESQKLR